MDKVTIIKSLDETVIQFNEFVSKLKKDEFVIKVGSKLRELRMEKGLTIEKLANNAEIERKQLSRIELGEINTSIYQVYNITHSLKVPIKDVFNF